VLSCESKNGGFGRNDGIVAGLMKYGNSIEHPASALGRPPKGLPRRTAFSAVNFSILVVALPTVFEFLNLLAQAVDFITQLLNEVFQVILVGLFFFALSHIPELPFQIFGLS